MSFRDAQATKLSGTVEQTFSGSTDANLGGVRKFAATKNRDCRNQHGFGKRKLEAAPDRFAKSAARKIVFGRVVNMLVYRAPSSRVNPRSCSGHSKSAP